MMESKLKDLLSKYAYYLAKSKYFVFNIDNLYGLEKA